MVSNTLCFAILISLASISVASNEKVFKLIIYRHAQYRKSVKASNMRTLDWSPKLARMADKFVESCPVSESELDFQASSEDLGFNFGTQSIKSSPSEDDLGNTVVSIIDQWGTERRGFHIGMRSNLTIHHWVQLTWADSYKIGCGERICGEQAILLCLYKEKADTKSVNPYKKGKPCSSCSPGFTNCKEGLCAPDQPEEDEMDEEEKIVKAVIVNPEQASKIPQPTSAPVSPKSEDVLDSASSVADPRLRGAEPTTYNTTSSGLAIFDRISFTCFFLLVTVALELC